MKAALLSHGVVNGVRVTVIKGQTESSPLEKSKMPGVHKLINFEFGYKGVRVRRAYRVGEGKLIGVKDEGGEVHSCNIQIFSGALHSV